MTSSPTLNPAARKARIAFVTLVTSAGFLAIGPADASPPTDAKGKSGAATYENVPSKGTGRKVG